MTNLDIIKSTYEGANSEENGRNLLKHLATDVRWTEAAGFPYAGTYIGPEAIVESVFKRLAADWDNYQFTVDGYVAQDDKVAAYGNYSGVHKQSGKHFTARVMHLWTLKQGKIVSFEQFVDSLPVVEATR
ncbi:nuclear transport factor 2 family protein [Hahella sp. CR1]|uniref:nuclear transport factor 2 family protein n=1 Tax=Hahella sp. CR1 TaxID=2992807 RepID=UPI0024411429|nr:nuclear transport factor 2 family protein [Hahella sp. CR1]MDG9669286.1 nuclear transport factor 2 family protein [Hahella sp. CR1]